MLRTVFANIPTSLLNVACLVLLCLLVGVPSPMAIIVLMTLALLADLLRFYLVSRSHKKDSENLSDSSSDEKDKGSTSKDVLVTRQQVTRKSGLRSAVFWVLMFFLFTGVNILINMGQKERNNLVNSIKMSTLGYYYDETKNYIAAVEMFEEMAKDNYAPAQHALGLIYYNGVGVKQDSFAAEEYLLKASENGFIKSKVILGWMYVEEKGFPKNCEKATKLLTEAMEEGSEKARLSLAYLQYNGVCGTVDYDRALNLLEPISDRNHDAQYCIGTMYINGNGVEKDIDEGMRWLSLSAQNGNQQAANYLDTQANN